MSFSTMANYAYSIKPRQYLEEFQVRGAYQPPFVVTPDAYESMEIASSLIPEIKEDIAFVDFVRIFTDNEYEGESELLRGALLCDLGGTPRMIFENARLGYAGAGPDLSRHILEDLGTPPSWFEALNDAARPLHEGYAFQLRLF